MQLHLSDTLEYDGQSFEYARKYFTKGLMNQGTWVYESQDGATIHYRPDTGLKRYVGPDGKSHRLEVADDVGGPGSVQLRDSEHRSY